MSRDRVRGVLASSCPRAPPLHLACHAAQNPPISTQFLWVKHCPCQNHLHVQIPLGLGCRCESGEWIQRRGHGNNERRWVLSERREVGTLSRDLGFQGHSDDSKIQRPGVCRNLNPTSRWQIMAFLSSPFFLNWVPFAPPTHSRINDPTIGTEASWQSRRTEQPGIKAPQVEKGGLKEGSPETNCFQGAARGGHPPHLPPSGTVETLPGLP